jgi:hypothetical protein
MSGKALYRLVILIFISCAALESVAQSDSASVKKRHKFTFYAGGGPNFYFNNLVLAKDYVNELNYSFVGRIMWEPEYNLSLGIESGYNRLYSVSVESAGVQSGAHIVNIAIPIQIVVTMKFCENFYGSFLMGQSILKNQVNTTNLGNADATTISLGDFGAAIGYKRVMSDRFYLGSEIKGFYSAKLQDKNIALVFLGGFRF